MDEEAVIGPVDCMYSKGGVGVKRSENRTNS